jgi:phosphatidylserine decarboxylase
MAQILVGATIVGSIETVWAGTITPPREGVIKRWTWPEGESEGSVALLKGQEMGRFKLGSTVINLFAPGKVDLVNSLESLSVTKIGQPLATSTEAIITPDAEPAPLADEEIAAELDASPLVDDKKDES